MVPGFRPVSVPENCPERAADDRQSPGEAGSSLESARAKRTLYIYHCEARAAAGSILPNKKADGEQHA